MFFYQIDKLFNWSGHIIAIVPPAVLFFIHMLFSDAFTF